MFPFIRKIFASQEHLRNQQINFYDRPMLPGKGIVTLWSFKTTVNTVSFQQILINCSLCANIACDLQQEILRWVDLTILRSWEGRWNKILSKNTNCNIQVTIRTKRPDIGERVCVWMMALPSVRELGASYVRLWTSISSSVTEGDTAYGIEPIWSLNEVAL